MKIQGNPWWNRSIGTIFPTAFVHSLPLCHSLVILTAFLTFSLLSYLLWWSKVQWVHLDHCKESACQRWRCKRHRFNLWVGKIPWRKKWQPTPVFLLGKSHGQWRLVGYNPTEQLSTHGYLWPLVLLLWLTEGSDDGQQFFSNKVFLN